MDLLIATRNDGKIKELEKLLADLPITLRNLNEFNNIIEADENGRDFAENAILKAKSYAVQTGLWALADDSGLKVEALGGAPGVISARYAGERATDQENIEKLLSALNKTGDEARQAKFICVMAIANEKGEIKYLAEGACSGKIAANASGANGFGYDPIFIPEGFLSSSFGELSAKTKWKISHRARAAEKIIAFLRDFIAV